MADRQAGALLAWYDRHGRVLPWRLAPAARQAGQKPDPYRVWLSEIMLQQTTVATVMPRFGGFIRRWPTVHALAAANRDDVLAAWAGLGYYSRARNLHRCALEVVDCHAGAFPADEASLRALPGIGPYTAAAIVAIAFDRPANAVDGNIERVMARLHRVETPLPAAKPALRALAGAFLPARRPGDHIQALMDLGATVCLPRVPRCGLCPLRRGCAAAAAGCAADLPRRTPKPERPLRRGLAYWLTRADGAVLLCRRPDKGLLGGMVAFPSGDWVVDGDLDRMAAIRTGAPANAAWRPIPGTVGHVFTHFRLQLRVLAAHLPHPCPARPCPGHIWTDPAALGEAGLPGVMQKVARHTLAHMAATTA